MPIGQLQKNTNCCYSNQRPAVTVPPHNNSNTLQNDVVYLDLCAVAKSTGKYKERFIVYRPRETEMSLSSAEWWEGVGKMWSCQRCLTEASNRLEC